MTNHKGTARGPRSHAGPRVVAPRNSVNVALPFSRILTEKPMKMTAGDWISLAGLGVSAIGFGIAIWQLARAANAAETAGQGHQPSQ
jgi:hypothetical protein